MRAAALALCACVAMAAGGSGENRTGDARWARAIVLKQEDLRTFDAQPPSAGKTCLPSRLEKQTAFARSHQFSAGPSTVTSRAWIFRAERHARAGFRSLVARDYAGCLAKQDIVGARILSTTQEAFGATTKGERFKGIRVTAHLSQSGSRFTVYVDLVFVRRGRALADAAFTSTTTPFGEAAEIATVNRMTGRMNRPPTG